MKISTGLARMKIKRWFRIDENQPVVPMARSRDGKKVRVTRGAIEYTWKDGRWAVTSLVGVELSGTVLKKDGSESLNSHERSPAVKNYRDPEGFTDEFAWLKPIVDLLRPTDGLSLTIFSEHEVPV